MGETMTVVQLWKPIKEYGPIVISIAAILITVGVYMKTVDGLEERVAKLEVQPRVIQTAPDPRLQECARLARSAYGDGSRSEMDERTDILMLRLGCNQKSTNGSEP